MNPVIKSNQYLTLHGILEVSFFLPGGSSHITAVTKKSFHNCSADRSGLSINYKLKTGQTSHHGDVFLIKTLI